MSNAPNGITMKQVRDYADGHVKKGRGDMKAAIDPRGLAFLQPKHYANIEIGLPPDDETHSDDRVFLRAVF